MLRGRPMSSFSAIPSRPRRVVGTFTLAGLMLLVAACGSASDGQDIDTVGSAISGSVVGCDYSWSRPSPASLAAQGYQFAARYLSDDTTGKNLSLSEAHALSTAGLDVVVVWEQNADDTLSGFERGAENARAAERQAVADGQPSGRPIYFAIDFDAQPSQQSKIDAYFDGVASVIGLARTGVYAGYGPTKRLFDHGKIAWGWQTYAWSAGQWDPRAQLRQTKNELGGGDLDRDEATTTDYGQWRPGTTPGPASCSVGGVTGTCISTSACAALPSHVSTAGACPGPADTECCTPRSP
jgi:hypothetical protein